MQFRKFLKYFVFLTIIHGCRIFIFYRFGIQNLRNCFLSFFAFKYDSLDNHSMHNPHICRQFRLFYIPSSGTSNFIFFCISTFFINIIIYHGRYTMFSSFSTLPEQNTNALFSFHSSTARTLFNAACFL